MLPDWQSKDCSIRLYLGDFLDVIGGLHDIDAVICDPPYGIDYSNLGSFQAAHGWKQWKGSAEWDKQRISKAHIEAILGLNVPTTIWGGNYYADLLPPSGKWLVWDKGQEDFTLADCELAWCSWPGAVRRLSYHRVLAKIDGDKVHVTQKPLEVIAWNIKNLPNPPRIIADPCCGSATTCIAAHRSGIQSIGCEKDHESFATAVKRIENELARAPLFREPVAIQKQLFPGDN